LTYGFMQRDAIDAAYRELKISGAIPGEERPTTLKEMTDNLARVPLLFSPGARWSYSLATDVAGYLVELISGDRFDEFLRKRIFDPLGMHDTGFSLSSNSTARFAANYRRTPNHLLKLIDDPQRSPYLETQTFLSGGGGLVSTAEDYRRFCQMLLN